MLMRAQICSFVKYSRMAALVLAFLLFSVSQAFATELRVRDASGNLKVQGTLTDGGNALVAVSVTVDESAKPGFKIALKEEGTKANIQEAVTDAKGSVTFNIPKGGTYIVDFANAGRIKGRTKVTEIKLLDKKASEKISSLEKDNSAAYYIGGVTAVVGGVAAIGAGSSSGSASGIDGGVSTREGGGSGAGDVPGKESTTFPKAEAGAPISPAPNPGATSGAPGSISPAPTPTNNPAAGGTGGAGSGTNTGNNNVPPPVVQTPPPNPSGS